MSVSENKFLAQENISILANLLELNGKFTTELEVWLLYLESKISAFQRTKYGMCTKCDTW